MTVISFNKKRQKPTSLNYDEKTGEPLYPYHPNDYKHLHIVGHLFENGQYLPVKMFVAPEMIKVEQSQYLQGQHRKNVLYRGIFIGFGATIMSH
jgi:hypothetical protein